MSRTHSKNRSYASAEKKKFLKIELKLHLTELTNISHYNYIIQSYDKTVVNQFYVEFKVNGPSSKM